MFRDIVCISDQFLVYFEPFNNLLREHSSAAYFIKVFYVYGIDLSILCVFVHWYAVVTKEFIYVQLENAARLYPVLHYEICMHPCDSL